MFAQYGPVRDVYLPLDYRNREPRGFAYVEYPFIINILVDAYEITWRFWCLVDMGIYWNNIN